MNTGPQTDMETNEQIVSNKLYVDGDGIVIERVQNVAPVIEDVKSRAAYAKANKERYFVGSIPLLHYYAIQREAAGDTDKERLLIMQFFEQNSKFSTGVKGL